MYNKERYLKYYSGHYASIYLSKEMQKQIDYINKSNGEQTTGAILRKGLEGLYLATLKQKAI